MQELRIGGLLSELVGPPPSKLVRTGPLEPDVIVATYLLSILDTLQFIDSCMSDQRAM